MKRILVLLFVLVSMTLPVQANQKTEEKLYFIDVGQADCILVESNGLYMLIDGGEEDDGEPIKQYLKSKGVDKLTYVIATHHHSDHIGGLDDVIGSFSTDNVIMPKVSATTKCFENLINAVIKSKAKVIEPTVGDSYTLGDFKFTILGPLKYDNDDMNNNSVVIKLVNKNDSFILTGDAETAEENDILDTGIDISANVLKAGHHGSYTSTSDEFLNKVSPRYAVISVGKDNSYGHPSEETITKLNNKNVKIYRTDINGTIIAESSGNGIVFSEERTGGRARQGSTDVGSDPQTVQTYILNKNSMKFHKDTCIYGKKTSPANKLVYTGYADTIKSLGYSPCKVCNP